MSSALLGRLSIASSTRLKSPMITSGLGIRALGAYTLRMFSVWLSCQGILAIMALPRTIRFLSGGRGNSKV